MNMNPEGEQLLHELKAAADFRKRCDEEAQNARSRERDAEEAYADWLVKAHGLDKGTIIEYSPSTWYNNSGERTRAIVSSWGTIGVNSGRYQNGRMLLSIDDPDELPNIYVRHALKSGGWSVRQYTIHDWKKSNVDIL